MNIFKTITSFTSEHASEILTAVGIGGFFGAIGCAIGVSQKATKHIDEAKAAAEEADATFTNVDALKACWTDYVPTVILAAASTGCILGAKHLDAKKNAALTAALALSETVVRDFDTYKEKVIEKIGIEDEKVIAHEAAVASAEKKVAAVAPPAYVPTGGKQWCFDTLTSRYFEANPNDLEAAVNRLNARMRDEMRITLNEFYEEIGLETIEIGKDIGWDIDRDGWIELSFDGHVSEDRRACLMLSFPTPPRYLY